MVASLKWQALPIHETATIALKHGAWSVPNGRVSIAWKMQGSNNQRSSLILTWLEQGGPSAALSARKGFGQAVLYDLVPRSLEGSTQGEILADGFRWMMSEDGSKLRD